MGFWQRIKRFFMASLRRRVRLGVGVVSLIAVISMVLGIEWFVNRTEKQMWKARQQDSIHEAARMVEMFLDEVDSDLGLVSELSQEQFLATPTLLNVLLDQNPALLEVVRLDPQGEPLGSAHQPDTTTVLNNLFTVTLSNWFYQAKDGESYIGTVQLSVANEPYLILAVPAEDGNVVAARLSLSMFWDVMGAIHYGDTGWAYMVDVNGKFIAPDPAEISSSSQIDVASMLPQGTNEGSEIWLGDYTNFSGKRVWGSTIKVPGTDWIVVTEIDHNEGRQTTNQAVLMLSCGAALLGLVIFGAASRLLETLVLKPLEVLRTGVRRVGAGHLDERIEVNSVGEINSLADAFNDMAARLQQKIEESEMLAGKANEANDFKSRLISRVSHELRNPLGGILGFGEMMQYGLYGTVGEQQRDVLDRIMKSAQYLNKLVNELLEQSRLENNHVGLTLTDFNPCEVVSSIVANSVPAAHQKGLSLDTDFTGMPFPRVMSDQSKLEQVVANLVGNAIKFTKTGSVNVRVFQADSEHWSIEVRDTGIGLSPDALEFIFEPFRQVDESITREHEGFGLGLSIVHHLTTMMNGDIKVTSEVGQGSTFTVTLPMHIMQDQAVPVPATDLIAASALR